MTENYLPASAPPSGSDADFAAPADGGGTTDVVKGQAADLGQNALDAGRSAVGTAREQASTVAAEAGEQATDLLRQAQGQLRNQATTGQQRLTENLHALSDGFSTMAERGDQPGMAADLARQAARTSRSVARWLEARGPEDVVAEVKVFARRRPTMFIAVAAGVGLLAGRLTRGLTDSRDNEDEPVAGHGSSASSSDWPPVRPEDQTPVSAAATPAADISAADADWAAVAPATVAPDPVFPSDAAEEYRSAVADEPRFEGTI